MAQNHLKAFQKFIGVNDPRENSLEDDCIGGELSYYNHLTSRVL